MLIVLGSVSHQNDEAAGVHTRQSFEEHFVGHFWLVRPVSSTSTGPLVLGLTVLCALGEICQDQLLSWGVSWSADRLGLFYVDQAPVNNFLRSRAFLKKGACFDTSRHVFAVARAL